MTRQDVTWVLELIKNRDARTDAERDAIDMAIEALQAKPKTGKWEEKYIEDAHPFLKHRFYCSNCGEWITYGTADFCCNCGADMRGGQDETAGDD